MVELINKGESKGKKSSKLVHLKFKNINLSLAMLATQIGGNTGIAKRQK